MASSAAALSAAFFCFIHPVLVATSRCPSSLRPGLHTVRLDVPSEGTSTAEFRNLGPATTISLQAHDPDAQSVMSNVLSVDFTVAGNDASAPLSGATISYFPDGMNEPFYSSESSEPPAEVTLHTLSLEDGAASVIGEFTAKLCRKAGMFSEADTNNCVAVEGTFETALRKSS